MEYPIILDSSVMDSMISAERPISEGGGALLNLQRAINICHGPSSLEPVYIEAPGEQIVLHAVKVQEVGSAHQVTIFQSQGTVEAGGIIFVATRFTIDEIGIVTEISQAKCLTNAEVTNTEYQVAEDYIAKHAYRKGFTHDEEMTWKGQSETWFTQIKVPNYFGGSLAGETLDTMEQAQKGRFLDTQLNLVPLSGGFDHVLRPNALGLRMFIAGLKNRV